MAPEEQSKVSQSSAAASARVTPHELAQAVARIEARQAEEARRQQETIPIGQAVQELGLGLAPEEILAEIEAQRGQEAHRLADQLADVPPPRAATPPLVPASRAATPPVTPTLSASPAAPVPTPSIAPAAPTLASAQPAASAEVASCPACGRKLLTRASALCNWCGERIENPDYQAQAEAQRHALDQAERTQVDSIAQEEAKFGVFGRLKRRAKLGQGPKPGLG